MLGDFYSKKKNIILGREICIELKIDWVEMKPGVRQMITIACVTYVQKDFRLEL